MGARESTPGAFGRTSLLGLLITAELILSACAAPVTSQKPEAPITRSGRGTLKTDDFTLRGGDYQIAWSADSTHLGGSCSHRVTLRSTNGRFLNLLVGEQVAAGQIRSGTTTTHSVQSGRYLLDVSSECESWSVSVARF